MEPEKFEHLELFFPPLQEQIEIVEYIDSQMKTIDKLIKNCSIAIELMSERRSALITAAVTGKIDVRNWQAPETNHASRKGISV
jgi:type I restriction enzyme S subunit